MREPNAIDFWRGFALVTIVINHIPDNAYQRITYSGWSISDAAELFVFLAGWSIGLATRGREGADPPRRVVLRLVSRMLEVYRAQIVTTALALAMIAAAALALDNPLILEWHNAEPAFYAPVQTTLGWVLMTHQLGFFNILPLYVVLLAMAPGFVLLARWSRRAALAASGLIYLCAILFEINIPSWPGGGHWFFNPFAWQFLMVLGLVCSDLDRDSSRFREWRLRLRWIGVAGVLVGLVVVVGELRPDPLVVPEPRLLFLLDKTYVSPGRLLQFFCLLLAFQGVFALAQRWMAPIVWHLSALGRNSLEVFVVGSLLSLAAQFVRFVAGGNLLVDTIVVSCSILGLVFTAWFVEWRSRSPRPSLQA